MGWSNQAIFLVIVNAPPGAFSGVFVYSPDIGAGNLIASIADQNGTDPYGNAYLAGVCSYQGGSSGLISQLLAGQLVLTTAGGQDGAVTLDMSTATVEGITGAVATLTASGGGTLSTTFQLASGAAGEASIAVYGYEGGFGYIGGISAAIAGTWNALIITDGGTPVTETWHAPAYDAGWAAGPDSGTVQDFAYRIAVDGTLQLAGAFHATADQSAGAAVFTLPAGWIPATTQRCPAVINTGGTVTASYLELNSDGSVTAGTAVASGADVYVAGAVRLS